MIDYSMKVVTNDSDNTQARVIIEVNGHEIDILADADGIAVDIQKDSVILTSAGMDWDEPHLNA